jgi:hypothetical protein
MPRVVRLGRAANDNIRRSSINTRFFVVMVTASLAMLSAYYLRLI